MGVLDRRKDLDREAVDGWIYIISTGQTPREKVRK